ncbi:MAG: class I SAM-dependent methyltransferase [Rubrivivax sp.]|nr:class I SAM-dependent methyltransferase [Rubrivivax sp.]
MNKLALLPVLLRRALQRGRSAARTRARPGDGRPQPGRRLRRGRQHRRADGLVLPVPLGARVPGHPGLRRGRRPRVRAAVQLAQIAQLNPQIRFHGVDLSDTMLQKARANVSRLGLTNVRFSRGDITTLESLPNASADGVISTMALHHLPTLDHLRRCFQRVHEILRPGGALYLVDFTRLKRLHTVIFFAYQNARHQPHLFTLDYERSLRAAFEKADFEAVAREQLPGRGDVVSTFMVPMLTVIKTADRPLQAAQLDRVRALLREMPARYRSDLNDMRVFFRLGGLKNDPFQGL